MATTTSASDKLLSAGLIEKDTDGDVLWVWSFPSMSAEDRELVTCKCGLRDAPDGETVVTTPPFVYSQHRQRWYYIYTRRVQSLKLPKVTHVSLVLVTSDFNPEKYELLASSLHTVYARTGSPTVMLERYLTVLTRGGCSTEGDNGRFVARDYDQQTAYGTTAIRDVIARFGIEIIFLYTAMLLKKRVVFYHSDVEELLMFTRTLPAFVWHRRNWSVVHPLVFTDGPEMSQLSSARHFVAGFTDPAIENRTDFCDVFVNIPTSEITVAPHAKDYFGLGKLHKELATFIVQCAEDENKADQQIITDIATKTQELLTNLQSLTTEGAGGRSVIRLETLRERKMAAATEHFLYNLATAEGLVET